MPRHTSNYDITTKATAELAPSTEEEEAIESEIPPPPVYDSVRELADK